ncbi:TolC family protein [Sphingomonas flavalba]|uniref:TolC family protein n=1 Tax=Sphingomonas flavalba TaxID=2559804 RepID=UPI00109E00DD|nr:TolC family protein [Sphingomonas flavalba]
MRVWLAAVVGVCAGPAVAQDAAPVALDYRAAQQRLLERSDAIAASDANLRGKALQAGATRSLGRPEVDVEAQLLDYQKTLYLPFGSLAPVAQSFGIEDPLRFRRRETAVRPIVTATLPFYTGGQMAGVKAGARAQLDQARAERQVAVDKALLQLAQAYYGQQLAEQALGVRRDVLAGLERHLSDAVKLEREQFISRAQRLQAQVARDDAARAFETAASDLASANAALAGLLRAPDGVRPLTPLFVDARALPPLETFTARALDTHPEIGRLRALEAQAEAGVMIEESKRRPTLYGFGQYNFDRRDSLLTDPDWSVGIGLRYKLASGLGRNQAVAAARQTALQADAGLREARTQITIGVTGAWNAAEAARKRFLLLDSALESAGENLRLQRLSYREQQATSLDVIDAELGLGRARIQRAQAAHDYVLALAQLLDLSGEIGALPDYAARADRAVR